MSTSPRTSQRCAAIAALTLAAVSLAAASPAAASPARLQLGRFAGYVWASAPVSSVSATFTVPRIRPRPPASAIAATWIGAQGEGAGAPFIQIGVNELRLPHSVAALRRNLYYAFWSDTKLHFHPRILFQVHAGDAVAASLRRTRDGWRLAIVDANTGTLRRFNTTDEASGPFTLAEWLQEDPTHVRTGAAAPYPRLSGGRFEQLRVNARTPATRSLLSQWMTIPRGDIAPSPIAGGAFSYHPDKLGRGWLRYRRLVAPEDVASEAFFRAASLWSADTPRTVIAASSAAFAAGLRANLIVLASQRWPRAVRPLIAALIRHVRSLLRVVESAPAAAGAGLAAWTASYHRHGRGVSATGVLIRQHLHGPILVA